MKSFSTDALPNDNGGSTGWRTKGLWIGAAALALLGIIFASGISWVSISKFAPYLLFLACPAMFLFMCHSQKKDGSKSDIPKD